MTAVIIVAYLAFHDGPTRVSARMLGGLASISGRGAQVRP